MTAERTLITYSCPIPPNLPVCKIARLDTPLELSRQLGERCLGDGIGCHRPQSIGRDRLRHPDTEGGFVLDGFPRTTDPVTWLQVVLLDRKCRSGGWTTRPRR